MVKSVAQGYTANICFSKYLLENSFFYESPTYALLLSFIYSENFILSPRGYCVSLTMIFCTQIVALFA